MGNSALWLDKLLSACQGMKLDYIDIIIDQCGVDFSVIPALTGFSAEMIWGSLYEGLPEDIYQEDAPLLMRIELTEQQQVRWLYELAHETSQHAPLMAVGSFWQFSPLKTWLKNCVKAELEGREGIFRFWDARVFHYYFSTILDQKEQEQLQQPAAFWSWMNRDGAFEFFEGKGRTVDENIPQPHITFSDAQFEKMLCLSDAKRLLNANPSLKASFPTKEDAFSACCHAMLAATREGILFEEARDAWVINLLSQDKDYAIK
ncbi:DUF4123 domain-containing protein [Nissabacter sp. SGAir0207]|uniref:DUF4123 domain-containing protein n=1 Tax=Nissabacter sp. SGAir0207 TaxID=2126321 RepID=UPI0010CCB5BE|nr:DUF4123 domain-containing protein [Nissabacter sp. SGAir0207]QCR36008.1 DUF4123 domain-containing protein [Nissabacter sp. SGAir0207]